MSKNITKKVFHAIGYAVAALACVYMLAFFLVFACLSDSSHSVADCRQNMAGEMIARSLSIFIK